MVKDQDLFAVGAEYPQINYENFWDWFVQFGDLEYQWKNSRTYLCSELIFILGGILTLLHALIRGGRLPYLWLGTVLHGCCVECLSYAAPDVDNFWHSQTLVVFLGRRLPLHIILLYPCFIYNASIAVAKLKLPLWSEPFAVGLSTVLVDIPYDIIGINYLHWTWHDTDPNIYDRHYWVPWNSYYFHICFAASFTFWFHFSRKLICRNNGKWIPDCFFKELLCTLIPSVMGTLGGILMFIPIYHPLHDIYKLHSEVTFFMIFTIFLLLAWSGDRIQKVDALKDFKRKFHWSTCLPIIHLLLHYSNYLITAIFYNTEDEVAVGLREEIGPCNQYVPVQTVSGIVLQKRKYLCLEDYDEKYFDFSCVQKEPSTGSTWYTICGVQTPNKVELIAILSTLFALGIVVYSNFHFKSFGDNVFDEKTSQTKKVKRN